MENFPDKKNEKLLKQLVFLENQMKNFRETFWRIGFKLIRDDPTCTLDTYFQQYFPSKEEISKRFDEERERLIKERTGYTKGELELEMQKFSRDVGDVELLDGMITGKVPIPALRKKKTIYSESGKVQEADEKSVLEKSMPELAESVNWGEILTGYQAPQRDPKSPEKEAGSIKKSSSKSSLSVTTEIAVNPSNCHCGCHESQQDKKADDFDCYTIGLLNRGEKIEIHIQKSKLDALGNVEVIN
jgi:hypothetical protein